MVVVRLVLRIDLARDAVEREKRVGADLLHQDDEGLAERGRGLDELAALEKVVAAGGNFEIAAVAVAALGHDGEVAVGRVFGHFEVEAGVVDGLLDDRVRGDIGHLLAAVEDGAVVFQGVDVLLGGAESHGCGASSG
ncbi:MAG: hypothetical protein AMXMBFR80_14430 [Dehalococcoidia bacterium]